MRNCGVGARRRRAFACLVAALACGAVPASAPASASAGDPPVAAAANPRPTPLLSVRRVPDWVAEKAAAARLSAALRPILARAGRAAGAHSCLVVTQGGRTLFASAPTREVVPASNLKLLTATAVLEELGGSRRYVTTVRAATAPEGGVVHGDLYLVGAGDPLLFTPTYDNGQDPPQPVFTDLATLAHRVAASGIRRVTGSVLGDESFLGTERAAPGWPETYEADGDVGWLSALEVDNDWRITPPYGPGPQPAVMAAGVFASLLRADGVVVAGGTGRGVTPASAVRVAAIASAPLAEEVGAVLRVSDDTGAELLAELLGRLRGKAGTIAAGVAEVRRDLAADGLPVDQLHQVDGSGLSTADRVSCALVADVLAHDGPHGAVFAGLPVAGRSGTLAGRMGGTPAAGRLHAKTGTLDGVSALSGFVLPRGGAAAPPAPFDQPVVFSLILDDLPAAPWDLGVEVGNAVGEALAAYPQGPPPSAAAPRGPGG